MSLLTSLISYWKMDEASGNALDAHGSNDLTDNNTVGSGTGKINNARDFESGSSEYFSKADNTDLSTGDIDFSIQLWMNPESLVSFPTPLSKDDNSGQREYGFYLSVGGTLYFYVFGPGGEFTQVAWSGTISTATWFHVVGWHDSVNNVIGISVNAGTAVTASHTAGVKNGTSQFTIGSRGDPGEYFDGLIDEVGFWKRVLTSTDRTDLYNSGSGLAYGSFGGTAYTLTADAGSFSLSGQAASLLKKSKLVGDAGAFSLTGQAAGLRVSRKLVAEVGAFTLAGQDAALSRGRRLNAEPGAFTLTGQDASLRRGRRLAADPGEFTLTGQAAGLRRAARLTAGAGAFLLSGQDATLTYSGVSTPGGICQSVSMVPTIQQAVKMGAIISQRAKLLPSIQQQVNMGCGNCGN